MKKQFYVLALMLVVLSSCNGKQENSTEVANIEAQAEKLDTREMNDMMQIINDVSSCLDSIQMQEQIVFRQNEETTDREKIVARLEAFKELLARKQKQINETIKANESVNKSSKKTIQNLQKMIEYLNQQLTEKTKQIEKLEELCQNKDMKIDALRYSVNELANESEYLKEQNYQQDKEINACYYCVASKSELKEKGLLKGGFLKKKKVDNENIDKSLFQQVDNRGFKSLVIKSSSPKIITGNPENSYTITKNEDGTSTLIITNPEKFWNVSKYLIIQL